MTLKDNILYLILSFIHNCLLILSEDYYKYLPIKTILFYLIKNSNNKDLINKLYNNKLKLGIIPDGNRRYFKKKGNKSDFIKMYRKSFNLLKNLIKFSQFIGIKSITVFCLSVKNLKRDLIEVKSLFKILNEVLDDFLIKKKKENDSKISVYGNLNLLPKEIINKIILLEEYNKGDEKFEINLLIGYSGKKDLLIKYYEKNNSNYRPCLLNIDCIIRTGNTNRLSDFMLYSFKKGCRILFLNQMFPEMNYLYFFYLIIKIIFY